MEAFVAVAGEGARGGVGRVGGRGAAVQAGGCDEGEGRAVGGDRCGA